MLHHSYLGLFIKWVSSPLPPSDYFPLSLSLWYLLQCRITCSTDSSSWHSSHRPVWCFPIIFNVLFGAQCPSLRVNPISLSYPFPLPLPLSFARSRESKGCPNSHFDRGVGLRARGRYPLKPSIFASLLETKGYPEHTAQPATTSARSSRESHFRLK